MTESTTSGGSNATDFQPTTGNPQANVSGSLQPNSATLQPITTSNGTNVFDQPGINPQAFPQTDSLRVLSSGTKTVSPSTLGVQTDTHPGLVSWGTLTVFFVVAAALLALILLIAKSARPLTETQNKLDTVPMITKPTKSTNKKKSGSKKKKTKKRK